MASHIGAARQRLRDRERARAERLEENSVRAERIVTDPSTSDAGHRNEGHLGEVVVERESFLETELSHHCEAGAVGE